MVRKPGDSGRGYCLDFEVDTGGHATMTVQSFQNNMAEYSDFFLEMIWKRFSRLCRQMTMSMNILKKLWLR